MREKGCEEKQEELLREYYSGQLPAPAGLYAATLQRLRRTEGMSKGAAVLGVMGALALLLLWGCLLSGPIPLLWKLTLLLSFGAAPAVAAVVVVLYMSGREAGSVQN
ncbi:hypothetical protein [Paenibacillus graminis]|uniref:hypothetical protein n=1 Tax=Paenibacillus graminis TaxID=189425 RepID=UPI000F92736E|nr:hypothetical protein [Paenibacillus graminis]MEC0170600.1 hypothetical protein [Paenibacillus graminis]